MTARQQEQTKCVRASDPPAHGPEPAAQAALAGSRVINTAPLGAAEHVARDCANGLRLRPLRRVAAPTLHQTAGLTR